MVGFDDKKQQDEAFKEFIKEHSSDKVISVLSTEYGIMIYSKNDDKFHNLNNSLSTELDDINLYNKDESSNKHILCVMMFETIDELLDYINENRYKDDIAKFMLRVKIMSESYGDK